MGDPMGSATARSACNPHELLAVLLSRQVREGEISACGAHSMQPAAGLLLAKTLHAPNAELIILGTPFMPFDSSRQFHFLAQRGDLGLFFVSGVQIDQFANYNLHLLGENPDRPKLRFPGGYGGGMLYYAARRTVIFRTEHSRRSLVPKVDFISAAGSTEAAVMRRGYPTHLITPMATLAFDKARGLLRLESVHVPHRVADVVENTGFELGETSAIPTTPMPTAEELDALRGVVRAQMVETGTYGDWALRHLAELKQ